MSKSDLLDKCYKMCYYLNTMKLNPFDFNQMMREIELDAEHKRMEEEYNKIPDEVLAEMEVRDNWPKISSEIKEKIRNGEPF